MGFTGKGKNMQSRFKRDGNGRVYLENGTCQADKLLAGEEKTRLEVGVADVLLSDDTGSKPYDYSNR